MSTLPLPRPDPLATQAREPRASASIRWPLLGAEGRWPLIAPPGASLFARATAVVGASAAVALAYALVGTLGVWLLHHTLRPDLATLSPTLGVPWLPVGIAVAGLMLLGLRAFPGVFLGSCLTWGVAQGDPWISVVIDALGETASVVSIVWMLRAWGYHPSLARYQDALLLVAAAALGRLVSAGLDVAATFAVAWQYSAPEVRPLLEAAGVYRDGGVFVVHMSLFASTVRWWGNSVAGIVLVVPLLAPFAQGERPRTERGGDGLAWALMTIGWLSAALLLPTPQPRMALLALALALVVSAALRFGVAVASAITLVCAIAATVGFALQLGVFAGIGGRERMEEAWGFIGLLAGAGLFLTPLLAGRAGARRHLAASVERYRRLFLANPDPMWAEDATSGRILFANDAAARVYGYSESALLRLRGRDLLADPNAPPGDAGPYETRHRTAAGGELEVEVTPVRIELEGAALKVCFVEAVGERNGLKLALLSAADMERHRLGQEIRDGLGPILARLAARVDELADAATRNEPLDLGLAIAAEADANAAATKCRQLNRGASPIQFASGDLLAALRRIPEELATDGGPELTVSVWSHAPVELSVERSEHLYRIAHDAARAALLRPGARRVEIAVDVTAERLSLAVDDDGAPAARGPRRDPAGFWPLDVRAAAARAQLSVGTRHGGGNRVLVEVSQAADDASPAGAGGERPEEGAGLGAPLATEAATTERYGALPRTLIDATSLFLACFAAGAIGLGFLQLIDPRHIALQPSVAIPWLASGVGVAGILLGGARLAPAVFLGSVAVWRGLQHDPWITVLFDAFGEALAAVVAVRLLVHAGFRRRFDRFRDLLALSAVAALSRLIPALFDAIGLHLAGAIAPGTLTPELREGLTALGPRVLGLSPLELAGYARWWVNGVAGVVLVVPAVAPVSPELRARLRRRWLEAGLFALALVAAVIAIGGGPPSSWRLPLLGLAVVLVAWGAVRFGVALASMATLLFSLAAAVGFGFGLGPIAPAQAGEGAEVLWGFIGLLGATGLFLTTVVAEHDATMQGLRALQARYTALFEVNPRPLFAFLPPAGRITMVNRAAINRYGYSRAQFLTMTLGMLAAERSDGNAAVGARQQQTRVHRTSDGECFDVELSVTSVDGGEAVENLCYAIDVSERDELRRRALEASDRERRRLAQELHDGLGQSLTGLQLGIVSVRRTLERDGTARKDAVLFAAGAVRDAIEISRQIVQGLSPLQATDGDLVAALERIPLELPPADRTRLEVRVSGPAALRLPLELREHLYQIAREALNNALKHAEARRITILMAVEPTAIELTVSDDGKGFDPAAERRTGLGLRSLALRAGALRGRLSIDARPGGGTTVTCRCPQPRS